MIAFGLLATVGLRRPLIARLADDFCAFPVALTSNLRVQRFFRRVSLLWALVFLTNGWRRCGCWPAPLWATS